MRRSEMGTNAFDEGFDDSGGIEHGLAAQR